MMLCLGMLLASVMDWLLQGVAHDWRWMVGLPAIPGALMGFSLVGSGCWRGRVAGSGWGGWGAGDGGWGGREARWGASSFYSLGE